jgi:predicted Zn-dependent protease
VNFDARLPDDSVNVSAGTAAGEAVWLVAGVVGVAVAAVTLLALGIDVAVRWLPPEMEARWLGDWAESSLVDETEGEVDPRQASVQAIADRLARHWPDAPYRFRVGVVEAPEPNAFALPGGWILVTTGLLDRIRNENELAFVLGHELGHFRNRDHLRGLGRGVAWSIVSATLGLGEGAASTLARVAGGLSNRHFDRDQESDADLVGLELLASEYGHVGGASAVFAYVLAPEADGDDASTDGAVDEAVEVVTGWISTHPSHANRIQDLGRAIRDRGYAARGSMVPWTHPPTADREDDGQGAPTPE